MSDHRIIIGESRAMNHIKDDSIDLIVTAPPSWVPCEGSSVDARGIDYESYINDLNMIWFACARVLRPGCRLCIGVSDRFVPASCYGRFKALAIRGEITRFCEAVGLDYMGEIIRQRITSKQTTAGAFVGGSYPYPRNGIIKEDFESILIFRKDGEAPPVTNDQRESSKLTKQEWIKYFNGHWYLRASRHNAKKGGLPAEATKRLIKMFSFVGETVLDPCLVNGTTSVIAAKLGRNSVGYVSDLATATATEDKILEFNFLHNPLTVNVLRERKTFDRQDTLTRLPYQFRLPEQAVILEQPSICEDNKSEENH